MAEPSQSWPWPLLFQPVNICPTCLADRLAEGLPKRSWVSTLPKASPTPSPGLHPSPALVLSILTPLSWSFGVHFHLWSPLSP